MKVDRDLPEFSFEIESSKRLEHARSVSLVSTSGTSVASSEPSLVGRTALYVSPAAPALVQRAIEGVTSRRELSALDRHGLSATVGAYPLGMRAGEPLAVLVDKSALSNPNSWGTAKEPLVMLLTWLGANLLLVVCPAIAVAAAIAIPRARAISRPVGELSDAALSLAGGRLDRRVTPRGEDEVALLATSFNLMAGRLEETITRESAERQSLEERTRELAALLNISQTVTSTLDLQPLVALILDELRSVVDYSGAALLTLEGDALVFLEARTASGSDRRSGQRIPVDGGPIWERITRLEPVLIEDVWADEPLAEEFRCAMGDNLDELSVRAVHCWLGVPLAVKDRVIGMLTVVRAEPGALTERHTRLVRAVADQAALAIENARLYQQAASLAAFQERARLARDLHDSVTQSVFSLRMMARVAQTQHERGAADVVETLERINTVAADALAEMRALIFELRPVTLEAEGLRAALARLVETFQVRTDAHLSFSASTNARPALDAETAMFRVVQEALGNAAKHARAEAIAVRLEEHDGTLVASVTDDGVSFDPAAPARTSADGSSGGIGLRSMRERAAAGITVRIESAPDAGTTVTVEAPVAVPDRRTAGAA